MTPPLTVAATADRLDTGGLEVTVTLTNDGEEAVSFSTASAQVFRVTVEGVEESVRWTPDVMYTQAFESWSIAPGEALTRTYEWQTPAEWAEFYEDLSYDMSVDDYNHPDPEVTDAFHITVGVCATSDLCPDEYKTTVTV